MFNAPLEPTEFTVTFAVTYTLESDTLTEIRKHLSLDIPVIQNLQASFDILPSPSPRSGMPYAFSEDVFPAFVSQRWLLITSIAKIGRVELEIHNVFVRGTEVTEGFAMELHKGRGCSPIADQAFGMTAKITLIEILPRRMLPTRCWILLDEKMHPSRLST